MMGVKTVGILEEAEALRKFVPTEKEKMVQENEKIAQENVRMCRELTSIIKEDILAVARRTPADGKPLQYTGSVYLGRIISENSPPFSNLMIDVIHSDEKHFLRYYSNTTFSITGRGEQILSSLATALNSERVGFLGVKCGVGYSKLTDYCDDEGDYTVASTKIGKYWASAMNPQHFHVFPFCESRESRQSLTIFTYTDLRTHAKKVINPDKRPLPLVYGLYLDYSVGKS